MLTPQNFLFRNIGEIFFEKELLTREQISVVLKSQRNKRALFGQLAVDLGFLREDDLLQTLAEIYFMDSVSLDFLYVDCNTLNSLDYDIATSATAIPFYKDETSVKIAISDPGDLKSIDKINSHFKNLRIEFFVAKKSEILHFLEIMKSNSEKVEQDPLLLLNKIIFEATEASASDIHFEPQENLIKARMRIDGILHPMTSIVPESWGRIKSKLKIISKLDIAESRRPQSGHARIHLAGKIVDLRISTHPGNFGENLAIRIFDLSNGVKSLSELGFTSEDFRWLKKVISFPSGIFLVVGPTGSGKTTTLYSLLREINSAEVNVMTLEDPIEYQIDGVKQLELKEDGLLSFADGVRSILRQDPDVMLIGEIRDEETAAMAVRASLTGRLALATLHAPNPLDGLRRLVDLGLKLSDFVPSLIGIFSQRLVRYGDGRKGRFPIVEYIYFSEELKKKLVETGDISLCRANVTFKSSAERALENNLTNIREIEGVLGNGDI